MDDVVCSHGTAMDVHCCNCHSGLLFDIDSCVCGFDGRNEGDWLGPPSGEAKEELIKLIQILEAEKRKNMTFEQYQLKVRNTWNYTPSAQDQIMNALLGLIGETGEIVEHYKKCFFHDIPLDIKLIRKEIGDCLYYLTALSDLEGENLEQIAVDNSDKLAKRYPRGFESGGGIRT